MNKTKIDWADMTWNPVTGCLHGCEYCYARKIANRFGNKYFQYGLDINELDEQLDGEKGKDPYPFGFLPTFHRYRLDEPSKIKKPQNIFVCSMADLFGDWVPDEWIKDVFKACEAATQHRYLFLTKNPKAYKKDPVYSNCQVSYKNNWWFGASITGSEKKDDIAGTMIGLAYCENSFLSIEPIHQEITLPEGVCLPKWIIVGSETGNRKDKPVVCKWWIDKLVHMCRQYGIPVFMKESLRSLMGADFKQEFPWGVKT